MTYAVTTGVTIDEVLERRLVHPVFQPIVDLTTRRTVGLEALARGPAGTALEFPDRLFAAARDADRVGPLDMLCAERALECALEAPYVPPLLFVNAEPGVLDQPISPRLIELIRPGLPFREVLEFTERALPSVPGSLLGIAAKVQQWGNGIALDDVGVDPMSLAFLPLLEPEVIKLDMGLVRDPSAATTRAVCALVREAAERTGAVVIAEGIETEADHATAVALGAHWGQGWLFGRPARIEDIGPGFDPDAAGRLRPPRPGFHQPAETPFEAAVRRGAAAATDLETALEPLRRIVQEDPGTLLVASVPAPAIGHVRGSLGEIAGRPGPVVVLDEPIADEFAVVLLGAGRGHAVCARATPQLSIVTLDDQPAVAAVGRALLSRQGPRHVYGPIAST